MDIQIAYRHFDSTPSIEDRIKQKAEQLKIYFNGRLNIDWICSVEKNGHHSDVTVKGDHFTYHASAADENLYKTFDLVIAKLKHQLSKKKDMQTNKIHRKNAKLMS